jgi:DNA-binding FrmR family transcriptional regulator
MNGSKVPNDGVDNVPHDPPPITPVDLNPPTPPHMRMDESPITKFKFQAKIDVNRERNDNTPLRIKAILIKLLAEHQKVDPTFHLLPTEDGSTASAITKVTEIPNSEEKIKDYVKEIRDSDNRNNSKYYTVVFYIKVASSMTLGMMKKDTDLFMWLRNNNIWIRAFSFTTTYDVVTAGFISNMHGGIHNRDRVNNVIQKALKENYPNLEVKLVPTTIKHGRDESNKRITHVVSLQADRQHINEAREALVHVFKLSSNNLPKEIFFVPSPVNGMIKPDLYYELVKSHHESMADLRSFAITGIANMQTPMTAQDSKDINSSIETTFEKIILNAKVPGTEQNIFSSIEMTSQSETEGRYLLLTSKTHLASAEYMIDELLKYVANNPELEFDLSIGGEVVRRANQIKVSKTFNGYTEFLVSKVPKTITTNPAQNAWHKRREQTRMDYDEDNFPALDTTKKARISTDETNTTDTNSTDPADSVLVVFEMEMGKEREHTEQRISEVKKAFADELEKMKTEILKQIQSATEASENRMLDSIRTHIGDILKHSEAAVKRVEDKASELNDSILNMLKSNGLIPKENPSTPSKNVDIDMQDATVANPITPASHENHSQGGMDTVTGERS